MLLSTQRISITCNLYAVPVFHSYNLHDEETMATKYIVMRTALRPYVLASMLLS